MPAISRFFGIVIAMYYNDHAPPHFQAKYGDNEALITIESLEVMDGGLPRRVMALVLEWAVLHRNELRENWQRARERIELAQIEPLE